MASIMEKRFYEVMEEGLNFFELGKYDDSIEVFSEAIAYARLLNQEDYLLKLMIKRADSYYRKGNYSQAIKHCRRLDKYTEEMNQKNLIDYHEILAISYLKKGKYEESMAEYKKIIQIPSNRAQFKAFAGLGLVAYLQAHYLHQIEKYETALFYYEKALKQNKLTNRSINMVLHNMGLVYYDKGYYQKALQKYQEALRCRVEKTLPHTYNELGKVYIRLNNLEKASEYIDKASTVLADTRYNDEIEYARNFFVKALYYKKLDQYDTAIFFFKIALNELEDKEIIAEMVEVYQELADTYKEIDSEKALDYLAEARYYRKMLN
mgnify:CR=1 FL=1